MIVRFTRVFSVAMACGMSALVLVSGCSARELRGAWVTAWTSGFFTPEEADSTVAAAADAGLNALFIQVRKNADAYYDSLYEPRGADLAPGFDPLAYLISQAHSRGIAVHAWINVYRVWTALEPPSDPRHLLNAHPEWINTRYDGQTRASEGIYLDPGVPEAREHIVKVIEDIVSRYDVDGIHLDYVRYPGKDWGYSPAALSRYYAQTGADGKPQPADSRWLEWRRAQVTELVRQVSRRVKAVKPEAVISAATIAWDDCPECFAESAPYSRVCQDWSSWLRDGLIDCNIPMNYRQERIPHQAQQFRKWLAAFKEWGFGRPVYVGLDVHHNQPEDILVQIEAVRKRGLDGFVLFSFNQTPQRTALVRLLTSSAGKTVAQTPPEDADTLVARALGYLAANQVGMARVVLKKALEADCQRADTYYHLGECYLREKNTAKAVEMFEKSLELDPGMEAAASRLESIRAVKKT